ncbi:MAG: hypothetical protein P1V97_21020 [Planctomycetota bacterium]|nr:hypothetical protein [Planctomycetota bacterium]
MTRLIGLFALLVLFAGCGTYTECVHPPSSGPRIYGGVKTDMEIRGVLYADVPLSAVGDTLLLPYTGCIAYFDDDDSVEAPSRPAPEKAEKVSNSK